MRTRYHAVGGKIAAGILTLPFIVPPWVTSNCAVLSSAVHSASGESNRIFTAALLVAVCMSVAVRAPVSGSYSITTPSRNHQCSASAEADRAGLSSEKCPEVLNRYRVRRPGREQAPAHQLTGHSTSGFYTCVCSASAASR